MTMNNISLASIQPNTKQDKEPPPKGQGGGVHAELLNSGGGKVG